ncbi:MAG: N-formylglutamate amidohydrolase [Proteobacteria bacterium]|nr:N-formylglutamate amidohydrolase [Pseudomonadota bacterium]
MSLTKRKRATISPAVKIPKMRALKKVLSDTDPPPFQVLNQRGNGMGLVICDHASNRVPRALKGLGLQKHDLNRHIGWDIGTEDVGKRIGKELDMPIVLANYSRLVVDLNRAPHHSECIPEVSDKTIIIANNDLSKKAKEQRLREIFWPYQKQLEKQINRLLRKGRPFLLAVHSFTPELNDVKRPWHMSVLWNKQEKIAKRLIAEIRRRDPSLLVGSNEPYTLKDERFTGSTMYRHAEERDLPYVFVEFRQDLIDTKEKAAHWANVFLQALRPILDELTSLQAGPNSPRKK